MRTAYRFMRALLPSAFWILLAAGTSVWAADAAEVSPLPNAHAHNDYAHQRPLFDALDSGVLQRGGRHPPGRRPVAGRPRSQRRAPGARPGNVVSSAAGGACEAKRRPRLSRLSRVHADDRF